MANDRVGVFAGTFNPYHIGHHDVVKQAQRTGQFDRIIIAVGINAVKGPISDEQAYYYTELEDKITDLGFEFAKYKSSLCHYLRNTPGNVTFVRGIRNAADLEYEKTLRAVLSDQWAGFHSMYFLCDPKLAHISSTVCRELLNIDDKLTYNQYTTI